MTESWRLDPTGEVDETVPTAVLHAAASEIDRRYHGFKHDVLWRATTDFVRMCNGEDGFAPLDTPYHDLRHTLACMLAMARLLDAHARRFHSLLSAGDALLGMLCALFHDVGYLRRGNEDVSCGAPLTPVHVSRGGAFLAGYLPRLGLEREAESAAAILHYTGYEKPIDEIRLARRRDHALGALLGTADILGQTADPLYPEKCGTLLWQEFQAWDGPYHSAEALLRETPEFHARLREERLEDLHDGAWHWLDDTMGQPNPYRLAMDAHLVRVRQLIERDALGELTGAKPQAVLPPLPALPRRRI